MKNQALFSLKDKSEKIKCCLLQFLFWALRVINGTDRLEQKSRISNFYKIFGPIVKSL